MRQFLCALAVGAIGIAPASAAPRAVRPAKKAAPAPVLQVTPAVLQLDGKRDERQLLVTAVYPDGRRLDVTRTATYLPPKETLSITGGRVNALRDGKFALRIRYAPAGSRTVETTVRVEARNSRAERQVSFLNDVIPALTLAGCNQGACHGGQFGRGGLRLSLLGYDPDADYTALLHEGGGRRVNRVSPERSLLLLKGTLALPHAGGMRLSPGSTALATLQRWVAEGAPGPREGEPSVVRVAVTPSDRLLKRAEVQQLQVTAHYSDGSTRDVTRLALYNSGNDGVASVSGEGLTRAVAPGAAAIVVRYQGQAAVARVAAPFARMDRYPDLPRTNFIDALVQREWQRLGLVPSVPATDAEFLRRASLDLTGTLPTPEQVETFLADCDAEHQAGPSSKAQGSGGAESTGERRSRKVLPNSSPGPSRARERLVDRLIASEEWTDYWALYFGDLLRNTKKTSGEKGLWALHNWIRASLRTGKPYNEMVRELVASRGSAVRHGAANFYNAAKTPEDLAETTSQVFLGVRMQCARCHNHPFERWTQADYYGLAAFFPGIKRKQSETDLLILHTAEGQVQHPRTAVGLAPTPLGSDPVRVAGEERPRALAVWLADPKNPFVARNIVNRVWARLMGRGLVEPVDDVRVSNPPTHPELLDALTRDFVQHNFDLRHLMRTIVSSRAYQVSSRPTPANERDDRFYTYYRARRLMAEPLLDAIGQATGRPEKFSGFPAGYRAISLPDPGLARVSLLDTFGRTARATTCECERSNSPNLTQTLFLVNSDYIQGRISDDNGVVATLVKAGKPDAEIIRRLYAGTLSRYPTPQELAAALGFLQEAEKKREGFEDLLWTLLNSQEFLLQH